MVPEHIARHVANNEKLSYEYALSGTYGEDRRREAEGLGLEGIVEYRVERPKFWLVQDLITGRVIERLFPAPDARCATCGRDVKHYRVTAKKSQAIEHDFYDGGVRCPNGKLRPDAVERVVGNANEGEGLL